MRWLIRLTGIKKISAGKQSLIQQKMKKVLIINEGFSHNLGDQAILEASAGYFKDKGYATDFLFLSKPKILSLPLYQYNETAPEKPAEQTLLYHLRSWLSFIYWLTYNRKTVMNKLKNGDYQIISIGGGQLINTSGPYLVNNFAIALFWISRLINRYSKKSGIYFIAVGVAEKFNKVEQYLYKKALDNATAIFVRDEFSQKIMKEIFHKQATIIPDIAFYSQHNKDNQHEKQNLALVGIANYDELELSNKTGSTKEGYYSTINMQINEYKNQENEVRLFYTSLLDVAATREFNRYLESINQSPLRVCDIQTLNDLTLALTPAKFVYSGRMHALILGLKYGCEVRPYLLSQKLVSFDALYVSSKKEVNEISRKIEAGLNPIFE